MAVLGGGMMKVTTVGLDLAKNVFSLHGVDERSNLVFRRTVRRAQKPPVRR